MAEGDGTARSPAIGLVSWGSAEGSGAPSRHCGGVYKGRRGEMGWPRFSRRRTLDLHLTDAESLPLRGAMRTHSWVWLDTRQDKSILQLARRLSCTVVRRRKVIYLTARGKHAHAKVTRSKLNFCPKGNNALHR